MTRTIALPALPRARASSPGPYRALQVSLGDSIGVIKQAVTRKSEKQQKQGIVSRDRILQATYDIASESGYEGTTIAAVTKRTGLPASSVYWHFKNKDELLAEVLEHSYAQWRDRGPRWTPPAQVSDLATSFADVSRQAAEMFGQTPDFWKLGLILTLQNQITDQVARARFLEIRRRAQAMVSHWWREVLPPETLVAQPHAPELLAKFIMSFGDGLLIGIQSDHDLDTSTLLDMLTVALDHIVRHWNEQCDNSIE